MNLMWVSRRERNETRALHPDDLAEWAEACGYVFDYDFIKPGRTVVRSSRDPESVKAAELLMDAWPTMSADERRLFLNQLRWIADGKP